MSERVVAIIQARMGSERLPGKIFCDIGGKSMLERVVRRTQRASRVDEVVVATTALPEDDFTFDKAMDLGLLVTRGSKDDVLDRYHDAALASEADHILRVTSDCPFIDAGVIDRAIEEHLATGADYTSTKLEVSFPVGLDTEVFTRGALERTWRDAKLDYERAHVTAYMYGHTELFKLHPITTSPNRFAWRWTVDTPDDLEFAQQVYARLGNDDSFSWLDVAALIEKEPQLAEINSHISAKPLTAG